MALEVFYDGSCPFCTRQAARLRMLDRDGQLRLTNLVDEPFAPEMWGVRSEDAHERLYGVNDEDATIYANFDCLLEIMKRLGRTDTARFFSLPIIKQIAAFAFGIFSSYRKYF